MKIIGKEKAPKAWCLMQDSKTGHYYVDYSGDWPLTGNFEAVTAKVAAAKTAAAVPEPVVEPKVDWPGFHPHARSSHLPKLTQEQLDQYAEYEASRAREYAHRQWEIEQTKANIVPLDYLPIFEDELAFVGYTRGRSSVTMQFEASNGQIIEFGPAGINGLIQGIIDGTCVTQVLSGTHEVQGEWNPAKQAYEPGAIEPRGKGIKATFKFTKKGQNVYAELVEV